MAQHWRNTPYGFGWIAIALHWISFLLVLFLLVEGIYMVTLTYYDPLYHTLPHWHKVAGILVLVLTLFRLMWRLVNARPAPLPSPRWQQCSARLVHVTFYLLLLGLGISGYIFTTAEGTPIQLLWGWQIPALKEWSSASADLAGATHRWMAYGIGVLMFIHSGAALFHHVVQRDETLLRILRPMRKRS